MTPADRNFTFAVLVQYKQMAFCCQCGSPVGHKDPFCGKCGATQPVGVGAPKFSISDHHASLLCYIPTLGWIAAILILSTPRFRNDRQVRFHAFQGLYLFVVWLLIHWVVSPTLRFPDYDGVYPVYPFVALALQLGVVAIWIFMLYKVAHHESYRLPFLGELAERSVSERHA
jgi:uncharacterized membrane protein